MNNFDNPYHTYGSTDLRNLNFYTNNYTNQKNRSYSQNRMQQNYYSPQRSYQSNENILDRYIPEKNIYEYEQKFVSSPSIYNQNYRMSQKQSSSLTDLSQTKYANENYTNGYRYQGNTLNGMKHGQGKLVQRNGEQYQGNWQNDRRNGYGIMQNKNTNVVYKGFWKDNLYDGQGQLQLANGDKYVGTFIQGQFDGYGKYFTKNGNVLEGQWSNGILYKQYNDETYQKNAQQIQKYQNHTNQINKNQQREISQILENESEDKISQMKKIINMNKDFINRHITYQKISQNFHCRQEFLEKLQLMLNGNLHSDLILDFIREGIRGRYNLIKTPFGNKIRLYADFTASGQDIVLVDEMMSFIQEIYSNTHTESSHDGKVMNKIFHDAQTAILKCCNADPQQFSVISVGSGCTGAIELAQKILGTYIAPKTMERLDSIFTLKELKNQLRQQKKLPLVLITSYEHHSNEITWKKQLCDVKTIPLTKEGYFDTAALENILLENQILYNDIICSFSAGSNVTGIKTDVDKVVNIVKKYNVLVFFDYAGVGPYVKINMEHIDGIYLSPHKFLGGPGSSGLLIIRNSVYPNQLTPTHGGGGTVAFVNDNIVVYEDKIMTREQSGTPGIVQTIRAALVFKVKELLVDKMHIREQQMLEQFFRRFKQNKNLIILGPADYYNRVSIVSFTIKHQDRILHSNFLVKLLSDLFGIQARSGCSCAGPYGHKLLNIDETISLELLKWIKGSKNAQQNFEGVKFGWGRVNLHYSLQQEDLNYIMDALEFISEYGYKFLKYYYFDVHTGAWIHMNEYGAEGTYSLDFRILLQDKIYAKGETDRVLLMQQHIKEAKLIADSIKPFPYAKFECLGKIAYFYAAKGNIIGKEDLKLKMQNLCNGVCNLSQFIEK